MREIGVPFAKGQGGRRKGVPNKATIAVREAAVAMTEDPVYRKKLLERLRAGTLAPGIEQMIWAYAYGKPKDTVAIEGRIPVQIIYDSRMKPPEMP